MSQSRVTAEGLKQLAKLRKLRTIAIVETGPLLDASVLQAWQALPDLRELILIGTRLDDDALQALGRFRRLERLHIGDLTFYAPVQKPGRPLPISSWRELQTLTIARIALTTEDVKAISLLAKLKHLYLVEVEIGDGELSLLRNMTGLQGLYLTGEFSAQSISALQHRGLYLESRTRGSALAEGPSRHSRYNRLN